MSFQTALRWRCRVCSAVTDAAETVCYLCPICDETADRSKPFLNDEDVRTHLRNYHAWEMVDFFLKHSGILPP